MLFKAAEKKALSERSESGLGIIFELGGGHSDIPSKSRAAQCNRRSVSKSKARFCVPRPTTAVANSASRSVSELMRRGGHQDKFETGASTGGVRI